ncbi:MAG: DUF1015 domain-containing protein [Phycisphaerales bacterium]|nr:MAG: DUF1015 domain-containing protein [Phycisphaerales bacterium]
MPSCGFGGAGVPERTPATSDLRLFHLADRLRFHQKLRVDLKELEMPEVAPFAAIRFDAARAGGDLSALLAPPYDVLDRDDKDSLLAKSNHNIVAVDLPYIPPKSAGPAEAYDGSAKRLNEWLNAGVLIRERNPAIYLYYQRFEHAGRPYTRRMFIARVRLQPFSEGVILPHEQTFGGPKEDRLALMKATQCQLSPIFGLYADPEDHIGSACADAASRSPDAKGMLDDVENRIWIITDKAVIDAVVSTMAARRVYIADGHHRYGTALMYRDFLASRQGGSLPADHAANYVMFVLASMDDPGCLILPYNRALADIDLDTVVQAWSKGAEPAPRDQADVRLFEGRTGKEAPLRFTSRDVLKTLEPDQCEAWRKLDYAYLHRYLIDELLERKLGGQKPKVRYVKSAEDAKRTARDEAGVALLTNATPMAHLRAVSESGGLMPQKSTYFHPKLATGLTINPLT